MTIHRKTLRDLSVLVALSLLVPAACGQREEPQRADVPEGVTADFRLARLDGEGETGPRDFAGKVVVVDFWATWCGPCHKQAEELAKVHAEYGDDEVQFLAVDLGEDEEIVRSFVEDNPFPYPVLLDPEDRLTTELGIYGLPTVMVVDRQGEVSYFATGILDEEGLRREIEAAGA